MPFQTKIQPIELPVGRIEPVRPSKFRLKRLFERQFKLCSGEKERDPPPETEPSSVCLAGMVQNFIEPGSNERPNGATKRCNCFNGSSDDLSDDEIEFFGDDRSRWDSVDLVKRMAPCTCPEERNLLGDISKILSDPKNSRKTDRKKAVVDSLVDLGHDAAVCLSHWDKSPSFPAGKYEYVDVMLPCRERLIVDLEFRSEFEIVRSTKAYRAALLAVPAVFVGRQGRLKEILNIMSEAALRSLKKKGLHVPPWRRADYLCAKWLSPSLRIYPTQSPLPPPSPPPTPPLLPPPLARPSPVRTTAIDVTMPLVRPSLVTTTAIDASTPLARSSPVTMTAIDGATPLTRPPPVTTTAIGSTKPLARTSPVMTTTIDATTPLAKASPVTMAVDTTMPLARTSPVTAMTIDATTMARSSSPESAIGLKSTAETVETETVRIESTD